MVNSISIFSWSMDFVKFSASHGLEMLADLC